MTEPQKKWTLLPLLQWSAEYLQEKGFTGNRLLAERLLAHVLQLSRVELYLRYDRPLSPDELAAFKSLFKRILAHEPLQYVLGETEFMSLLFAVGPDLLFEPGDDLADGLSLGGFAGHLSPPRAGSSKRRKPRAALRCRAGRRA